MPLTPFFTVNENEAAIVEQLGAYVRTATTGRHWMIPIFQNVRTIEYSEPIINTEGQVAGRRKHRANRIRLSESRHHFLVEAIRTKNNFPLRIEASLHYKITDAFKVAYHIMDFTAALEKITHTTLQNVIGELELDEAISSHDDITNRIQVTIGTTTRDQWGVEVIRLELRF